MASGHGHTRRQRQFVHIELRTNIEHLRRSVEAVNRRMRRTSMAQSWIEVFADQSFYLAGGAEPYVVTSLDGAIVSSVDSRVRDHIRKFHIRITPYLVVLEYQCAESYSNPPRGNSLSSPLHDNGVSIRPNLLFSRRADEDYQHTERVSTATVGRGRIDGVAAELGPIDPRARNYWARLMAATSTPTANETLQSYPWHYGIDFRYSAMLRNPSNYVVYPGFVPPTQNVNLCNPQSAQGAQGQHGGNGRGQPIPAVDLHVPISPGGTSREIFTLYYRPIAPIVPVNILTPTVPAQANIPAPAIPAQENIPPRAIPDTIDAPAAVVPAQENIPPPAIPATIDAPAAVVPAPVNRPVLIVPALQSGSENTAPANRSEPMVPGENRLETSVSSGNGLTSTVDEPKPSLSHENEENTEPPASITHLMDLSVQGPSSLTHFEREGNAPGPARKIRKSLRLSKLPATEFIGDIEPEEPVVNDENAANVDTATNMVKKRGKRKNPGLIPQPSITNPSVANEKCPRTYRSGKRQKHLPGKQKGEEIDSADTPSIHPSASPSKRRHCCKLSGYGLPTITGSREENAPGTSANINTSAAENDAEPYRIPEELSSFIRSAKRKHSEEKVIQAIVNVYNMHRKKSKISGSEATSVEEKLKAMYKEKMEASTKSFDGNQVDMIDASVSTDRTGYCASVISISSSSDRDDNIVDLEDDAAAPNEDNNEIDNAMYEGDDEQQQAYDYHNEDRHNQGNFRNLDQQIFGRLYEEGGDDNGRVEVGNAYELYDHQSMDDVGALGEINEIRQEDGDGGEINENIQENGNGESQVGNLGLLHNHVDELNRQIAQVVEDLQPVILDMDPNANLDRNTDKVITINSHPRMQIDVVVRPGSSRHERTNELPQNNEQPNHSNCGEVAGQRRHAHGVNPDNRRTRQGESYPVLEHGRNNAAFPNVGNGGLGGAFHPVGQHATCFSDVRQPSQPGPIDGSFHFPQNIRPGVMNYNTNGFSRSFHFCARPIFAIPLLHPDLARSANQPGAQPRYNMMAQQPPQDYQMMPPYVNPNALADLESYMRPLVTRFGLEEMRQVANAFYNLRLNHPEVWRQMQEKSLELCNFLRNLFG